MRPQFKPRLGVYFKVNQAGAWLRRSRAPAVAVELMENTEFAYRAIAWCDLRQPPQPLEAPPRRIVVRSENMADPFGQIYRLVGFEPWLLRLGHLLRWPGLMHNTARHEIRHSMQHRLLEERWNPRLTWRKYYALWWQAETEAWFETPHLACIALFLLFWPILAMFDHYGLRDAATVIWYYVELWHAGLAILAGSGVTAYYARQLLARQKFAKKL